MPGELAQILVALATLVSSLAGLVVAIRTGQKTSATHELVNGASTRQDEKISALTDRLAVAQQEIDEVGLGVGEPRRPGTDRSPTLGA